jgi:hypothetical protein
LLLIARPPFAGSLLIGFFPQASCRMTRCSIERKLNLRELPADQSTLPYIRGRFLLKVILHGMAYMPTSNLPLVSVLQRCPLPGRRLHFQAADLPFANRL